MSEYKEKCLGWKKKVEGAEYNTFFLACAILVLLLEAPGVAGKSRVAQRAPSDGGWRPLL